MPKASPSFFDTFVDSGGSFVNADERAAISEAGMAFPVKSVVDAETQFGQQYLLNIELTDPATGDVEERTLAFAQHSVESRDRMLVAMMDWFSAGNTDPIMVKLEKVGRSWILRKAE